MENRIIVLGMFDGVHMGHARLFEGACELKAQTGLPTMAYTFSNHPAELFAKKSPKLLLSTEEKKQKILSFGIDEVVLDVFDINLCYMMPYDFAKMLKNRFGAKHVIIGFNYSFGKDAMGNAALLEEYSKELDFRVHTILPVMYDGDVVSSSRIRKLIENGNIQDANKMLMNPYGMGGIIQMGRQVGRQMGFPTANIIYDGKKPLPTFGVYATNAVINGKTMRGVTNVGNNPTFGENCVTVETHIFDFDSIVYGEYIKVRFLDFVRPQRLFSGMEELARQIASDKETARAYHSANS